MKVSIGSLNCIFNFLYMERAQQTIVNRLIADKNDASDAPIVGMIADPKEVSIVLCI